jgi:hypothetical protein
MVKMDLQYTLKLNDEITEKIQTLKNLGNLRIETDMTSDEPYFVVWSNFEDPWDSCEAFSNTPAGALEEVYQDLWYILWKECESITYP